MIRDRTQVEDNDETSEDDDDYEEPHKSLEVIIINLYTGLTCQTFSFIGFQTR